ncbi:MAG: glutamine amidotransferase [Microbacterium sp.]|uniref:type 1 glutamine amidotransferase n=1 Tax=Microbacterium sp. TaxID=51671 RepID=UPI001D945A09|nr:glutamine amidotransferase [Microbacterium sp.]MBW8763503.1 glutamine amidotransferase [Microbacterium sp.]
MTDTVRIVQFYPVELGITGDRGNVRALQVRLERAGVPVDVVHVGIGDPLPADADILVFGNGPLSAMRLVADDLRARSAELEAFVAAGGSLFSIGASAELLSEGVDLLDGEKLEGLGLFPFRVARTRERNVGYIIADTVDGRVIGFEDHASRWMLGADAVPYGAVVAGKGSFARAGGVGDEDGSGAGEIVRRGEAYASNVQGPALPLNPQWADAILSAVTSRRGIEWSAGEAHAHLNEYADGARAAIEHLIHSKDFRTIGL